MQALDILRKTVELTVGTGIQPRPGQTRMCTDVANALDARGAAVGVGPTGVGKTFALLAAAAERAEEYRERSIISTESLSLQAQVLNKDAPAIIAAVQALGGRELFVAVLKGVNNYLDPRKLLGVAHFIVGHDREHNLRKLAVLVENAKLGKDVITGLDGANPDTLIPLIVWGLNQYDDDNSIGDRHSYDAPHTDLEWAFVSASSADATGIDDTSYIPKAILAKEKAAVADIVITNHTMLAIQAATGIPIVIGNKNLGQFDHIIVDEAHALPGEVRNQGASEVSGRSIHTLMRAVQKVVEEGSRRTTSWVADGQAYADLLDEYLKAQLGGNPTLRLDKVVDPLGDIGLSVKEWAKMANRMAEPASKSPDVPTMVKGRRAIQRADELVSAIDSVSTHRSGEARWIERAAEQKDNKFRSWTSAQSSPVDVSGKISRNLWVRPVEDGEEDEVEPLGVVTVSATLPQGFAYQVGLSAQAVEYESPFTKAYANSVLFIPSALSPEDQAQLTTMQWGKPKFDTGAHKFWAKRLISELVFANQGSALVLASSGVNGQEYAKGLRIMATEYHVHSQWDGETPAQLMSKWRDDESSVLVGTRSLMTGVDAPGETCSLVILDRIPRKPSNAMDDARVDELTEKLGDKWAADRLVYASDAALLEEQAIGRLIRSMNDTGMVAVLDPRLLQLAGGKRGVFTYPEPTRQVYMKPLYKFPVRTADKATALKWLEDRQASR